MGYAVTAVEIEPRFIELLRRRSAMLDVNIELIQADMLEFTSDQRYDAVVFFASFHHCTDHLKLLNTIQSLLNPDGMIVFAAEPIAALSHPWGLIRSDGLTLWSIRRMGWFELGFDQAYFLRTLLLLGWLPEQHTNTICGGADVYVARRSTGRYQLSTLTLPPDEALTWCGQEPTHRFTTAHSVLSCDRSKPVRSIEICLSNPAPFAIELTIKFGQQEEMARSIPACAAQLSIAVVPRSWQGQIIFESATWNPSTLFGNADQRQLGVAVHWVHLVYAED